LVGKLPLFGHQLAPVWFPVRCKPHTAKCAKNFNTLWLIGEIS
jgi:hypothetical protein